MVVFGQIWWYLGKFVVLGKFGFICESCLYLGKKNFRAKSVVIAKSGYIW